MGAHNKICKGIVIKGKKKIFANDKKPFEMEFECETFGYGNGSPYVCVISA